MTFEEFFQQYQQLRLQYPIVPTHSLRVENCDFGDYLVASKSCYFAFDCAYCEDSFYLYDSFKAKNCVDGDYVIESELVYDSVDTFHCYNSAYINYCARMYDSYFCWDCDDSHNLFGCVHLKHKQYCIFNCQYSKDDYFNVIKGLLKLPPEENLHKLKQLVDLFPMTTTNVTHAENCDFGNHVHYSSNLYLCFDSDHSQDCGYLYDSHFIKNSFDLVQCAHCELCYQCNDSARLFNCLYMDFCEDCFDSGFCYNCNGSDHLFGCVLAQKKKYCFLNKSYPKEEWERLTKEVMDSFRQSAR